MAFHLDGDRTPSQACLGGWPKAEEIGDRAYARSAAAAARRWSSGGGFPLGPRGPSWVGGAYSGAVSCRVGGCEPGALSFERAAVRPN